MKTNIIIAAAIAATLSLVSINASAQRCAPSNNQRGERTEVSDRHNAKPACGHADKKAHNSPKADRPAPRHECTPQCHDHGPRPAPAPCVAPAPAPAPCVVPAPAPAPARRSIDITIGGISISVNS